MDIIDDSDFLHDYTVSFGVIISNVLNLVFPTWLTILVMGAMATGIWEAPDGGKTNHMQSTN